jgi:hypothetical protein
MHAFSHHQAVAIYFYLPKQEVGWILTFTIILLTVHLVIVIYLLTVVSVKIQLNVLYKWE